ncbi:glycoside hydrolase family 32 protein [Halobacillus litoralis]|uniref:glycoside hydrolase family 32 protein n=1 Tax=Halobacillus litoralis TaxID=45668 RepID=UPI001CD2AAB7|nr:glycoside hydrolase family 32 protein [Halobacillus litoralis]MCA0972083.1 glycoside hydrolase family 32 protein [Halobacillus litoralis]
MPSKKILLSTSGLVALLLSLIVIFFVNSPNDPPKQLAEGTGENVDYDQTFRPQFHYTPAENWMNDPNGMVYYEGEYHLFYQYNPKGDQFGNMSWGHAVSEDLVHWEELDVAMTPDEHGMIFSGSIIADEENKSGLFPDEEGGLVAFYTSAGDVQDQRIAYSTDKGRTWTKYEGNPVVPNPGIKDFRDPKVIWHEESEKYIMLLAAGNKIMFYGSRNLIDWDYLSEFGEVGAQGGVWETPELFELPVDGKEDDTRWVLQVDMNPGSIAGGSGGQYFLGDFNGTDFIRQEKTDDINWTDFGKDFYAAQAFNGKEDRLIWMAWMSNWQYAGDVPTEPWRGAMSIPREVTLVTDEKGEVQLAQQPAEELEALRGDVLYEAENKTISGPIQLEDFSSSTYEIVAEFDVGTAGEFGFRVRRSEDLKEETIVGYDTKNDLIFTDRMNSGKTSFHEGFPGVYRGPSPSKDGTVTLRIFVDRSSVELFANGDQQVMTNRIFPFQEADGLEVYSKNGDVTLKSMKIYEMNSIWNEE